MDFKIDMTYMQNIVLGILKNCYTTIQLLAKFSISNYVDVLDCEETQAPGGDPHSNWKNMQMPHSEKYGFLKAIMVNPETPFIRHTQGSEHLETHNLNTINLLIHRTFVHLNWPFKFIWGLDSYSDVLRFYSYYIAQNTVSVLFNLQREINTKCQYVHLACVITSNSDFEGPRCSNVVFLIKKPYKKSQRCQIRV